MFNLGTVIKFEIFRTLKKPTFWIAAFSIPLIWGAMFGLGHISGQAAKESQEKMQSESFSFEIIDESKIVSPEIIASLNGKFSQNRDQSIKKVKQNQLDAFYFVPANLQENPLEIYAHNQGFSNNGKYEGVINSILKNSATNSIDPSQLAIANSSFATQTKYFEDGKEHNPIAKIIAPAFFLAVFYFVFLMMSNQMLTSTTEEKENRVTEMILTSISAKTLIVGKIVSLIFLGIVQILIVVLPVVLLYFFGRDIFGLPELPPILTQIEFEFWPVFIGFATLVAGFMTFTGFAVMVGAMAPTAKDANNFYSPIVMTLLSPLFVIGLFTASEPGAVAQFMTFFPLTSPIALLIRNALGNISTSEAVIAIGILIAFGVVVTAAAIKIFQHGTIAYNKRLSLKSVFNK